jgi:hypothetical protein
VEFRGSGYAFDHIPLKRIAFLPRPTPGQIRSELQTVMQCLPTMLANGKNGILEFTPPPVRAVKIPRTTP